MKTDIAILYATMTGNARECAEKASVAVTKAGHTARVCDLALYDPTEFPTETTVLIAISTWGDGEPPDDAVGFYDYVKSLEAPSLANLRFAVFALGDTAYEYFCKCGCDFDTMLEERGAVRLLPVVTCDVDFIEQLETWCRDVAGALPQTAGV